MSSRRSSRVRRSELVRDCVSTKATMPTSPLTTATIEPSIPSVAGSIPVNEAASQVARITVIARARTSAKRDRRLITIGQVDGYERRLATRGHRSSHDTVAGTWFYRDGQCQMEGLWLSDRERRGGSAY